MITGLDWLFINPSSYVVIPVNISQDTDYIKDYLLPLIPSILTIAGWIILSNQEKAARNEQKTLLEQEIADRNKEDRIKKILLNINEIKDLSFNYYQLNGSIEAALELNLLIQARIQQLNHFIARGCCESNSIPPQIIKKFNKFRRVLTGGLFGSRVRPAINLSDPLYSKIIRAELDLYLEIEKLLP
ncbi:hypothetical protein KTI63_21140 [Acinetobacter guillouiae]|uniref:hypothetical protein n=1 Tax=Acinetobacter guillouiae TaxID=106649 RepID=UPI0021D13729|nr:hypothetical protein [Acinetobacter guillouiae]MCU4494948.1 hypothetical protein [Acinetobacter guillouiae]